MVKPNPAGSLGSYLRALREKKNVSVEEIAQATRVSVRQLQALESDDVSSLPAPVFVRGFIRAFCRFLEEPPEEALDRLRATSESEPPRARAVPQTRATAPSWTGSPVFISLVMLAIFGGGLLALNLALTPPRPATTAPLPTPSQGRPAPTTPTPSARSGDAGGPERAGAQHLVLSAIEPAWVRIQADDGKGIDSGTPGGFGLTTMTERVKSLRGTCVIDSARDKGTAIRIEIPVQREKTERARAPELVGGMS